VRSFLEGGTRFKELREATPGPSDYHVEVVPRQPQGITIPKTEVEARVFEENLAPGYYQVVEEAVRPRHQICRFKPPKVPKKNIEKVAEISLKLQHKPTILSGKEFDQVKKIKFDTLEVIEPEEVRGPGCYEYGFYESVQHQVMKKTYASYGNSAAFISPNRTQKYRETA